jgi:hypothetical protein
MNKSVVLITGASTGLGSLFGRPRLRKGVDYFDPYPINAQYISSGRKNFSGQRDQETQHLV